MSHDASLTLREEERERRESESVLDCYGVRLVRERCEVRGGWLEAKWAVGEVPHLPEMDLPQHSCCTLSLAGSSRGRLGLSADIEKDFRAQTLGPRSVTYPVVGGLSMATCHSLGAILFL